MIDSGIHLYFTLEQNLSDYQKKDIVRQLAL